MWKRDGSLSPWKVQHRWNRSLRMEKRGRDRLLVQGMCDWNQRPALGWRNWSRSPRTGARDENPPLRMKKTLWGRLLRLGHSGHPFQALSLYQALEEGSPFPMLSLLGWSQMKSNY